MDIHQSKYGLNRQNGRVGQFGTHKPDLAHPSIGEIPAYCIMHFATDWQFGWRGFTCNKTVIFKIANIRNVLS